MYGNPYAPPPSPYGFPPPAPMAWGGAAFRVGPAVSLSKGTVLPAVCVKCGTTHGLDHRRQDFKWSPPWAYAMICFGWLIGLIVVMVTRKTASFSVPICSACNQQWNKGRLFFGLSFLPGLALLLLSFVFAGIDEPDLFAITILLSLVGFLAAPIITVFAYSRPRQLWVSRIDDLTAHVRGMHPQAVDAVCAQTAQQAPAAAGGYGGGYAPAPAYGGYGPRGGGPPPPPGGFGAPY